MSLRPRIVAELGASHNGGYARALRLIDAAKEAGADAVKLQTYRAESLTLDHDGPGFTIESGIWKGRRLHDLYREAQTPWDWHPGLFAHARQVGITCFSSPFDCEAVDFLETLGCPGYKIASFEITDTGLIAHAAKTGKPLIISTGMASDTDIEDALNAAARSFQAYLLHCVSAYPTRPEDANLSRMKRLRDRFDVPVGLSDHTLGIAVPVAAAALGAATIEKHLTLSRDDGGPDAAFSLEPGEFRDMVASVHDAYAACFGRSRGTVEPHANLRRSLYAVNDIAAGEALTRDNVRSIRPGHGLAPKHLSFLLGKSASVDIPRGTPMHFGLVG
jgi:N-acetylneuraminate synthase